MFIFFFFFTDAPPNELILYLNIAKMCFLSAMTVCLLLNGKSNSVELELHVVAKKMFLIFVIINFLNRVPHSSQKYLGEGKMKSAT